MVFYHVKLQKGIDRLFIDRRFKAKFFLVGPQVQIFFSLFIFSYGNFAGKKISTRSPPGYGELKLLG